jgi:crotonobetainyl-CoA:carnitine CoA-transferase CaiB-like acyl-CoA transferase
MGEPFLSGVRVLDLSQYVPGPYAAQLLADLGAEVIKIEPPGGDPMRGLAPRDRDGVSPLWKLMNAGKSILELDLKHADGAAVLGRLVAAADVLLESYRPGVLARLGFGRAALANMNARIVHAALRRCESIGSAESRHESYQALATLRSSEKSINSQILTGYGQSGPWRERSGHDINYMSVAGGLAASGSAERPVAAYPPTADFASAQHAAFTIAAALVRRGRTGEGAFIDLSLADTVLAWQSIPMTLALRRGAGREAQLLNGGAACYRLYRCGDGRFVSLGAIETKFWGNFCAAVARRDWIARQEEAMPQLALIADVATLFASRSSAAWETILGPADCCFAVVLESDEITRHPQIAARSMVTALGGADPRVEIGFPAWIDGQPPGARAPPRLIDAASALARWPPR